MPALSGAVRSRLNSFIARARRAIYATLVGNFFAGLGGGRGGPSSSGGFEVIVRGGSGRGNPRAFDIFVAEAEADFGDRDEGPIVTFGNLRATALAVREVIPSSGSRLESFLINRWYARDRQRLSFAATGGAVQERLNDLSQEEEFNDGVAARADGQARVAAFASLSSLNARVTFQSELQPTPHGNFHLWVAIAPTLWLAIRQYDLRDELSTEVAVLFTDYWDAWVEAVVGYANSRLAQFG